MTTGGVIAIVACFLAMDAVVVGAVFSLAKQQLLSLAKAFPDRPRAGPAQTVNRRSFQSLKIGMLNLGGGVHIEKDDQSLHMRPVRVLRWLGATPMSIPLSAIEPVNGPKGRPFLGGRRVRLRTPKGSAIDATLPTWTVAGLFPDESESTPSHTANTPPPAAANPPGSADHPPGH